MLSCKFPLVFSVGFCTGSYNFKRVRLSFAGIETGDFKVFEPKFYNLDDSVVVWSDFLKPHLHPKTMAIVKNFQHGK